MQVSFRKKTGYMRRIIFAFAVAIYLCSNVARSAFAQSDESAHSPANLGVAAGPADQSTSADNSDSTNESATALAKKLQNPIGNLYSIPFQSNTNFNYGPNKGTQELVNIQPVLPIHLNDRWNIITRTILPLIWQPSLRPAHTVPFGTGAASFSAFLSPANPSNGWLWGAGPIFHIPTATSKTLGSNVWGGGPTGVLVYMKGTVVAGVLVNNVWSFGGTSGRGGTSYNNFLVQPFFNYNFGGGWYAGTSPVVTANWKTSGNNAWTLPLGGNIGRVIKLGGKLPINLSAGAYANVLRPEYGATWQLRTQATVIF
jgi:hypothetical protein